MEKKKLKLYLLLIAYILALILVVVHFKTILKGIGLIFHLLTPLFIGIQNFSTSEILIFLPSP